MKKDLRLKFMVAVIALLTDFHAGAQARFTTVTSNKEIGRNDYVQVNFIVENASSVDQFIPPSFPGFRIISGPNHSTSTSIVNGTVSQVEGLSFVLQPVKMGRFTIQGATASIDGHTMHSKPVVITVNATGSGSANNSPGPGSNPFFQPFVDPFAPAPEEVNREYLLKPGENVQDKIHKNLFVKVEVDKSTCFVGEPVVATYKLYSRLRSESRVTKRPSLNGFSVYDMVDPNNDVSSVEKINGKPFTVHTIRKSQLIPLQAGTVDLDPMEVENTIHFLKGSRKSQRTTRPGDVFDPFEDDDAVTNWVDENITLDTKPVTITVKPLPETTKPADYNGAVGQFSITAGIEKKNIAARDEATLQVVIKGSGNLPIINAPKIKWPAGLESFDPVTKEEVDHTTVPMSGSKIFRYVFTPDAPGEYKIPSLDFSYFDPVSQKYRTIHTDSLTCKVGPAIKRQSPDGGANPLADTAGNNGVTEFVHTHLEWTFAVLIFSALAIYLWRQGRHAKKEEGVARDGRSAVASHAETLSSSTPAGSPSIPTAAPSVPAGTPSIPAAAPVIVADPLSYARIMFEELNYKGFYKEVNRVLWQAITDSLELPSGPLNKSILVKKLETRGWDRETVLILEHTFSECEINIYTPVYDTYNMQQVLNQAELLIAKL